MCKQRNYFRKTLILLAIGIPVCGAYSLSDRLKWIDSLFIVGLLFLVFAGAVTVWRGGFFRVFLMGMRRQFGQWEDSGKSGDSPDSPRKNSRPWIVPAFFAAGLLHMILSILLLLLY